MSEASAPAPAPQLPSAPAELAGEDGAPRMGLYSGAIADPDFSALEGAWAPSFLERRFIEKTWQYATLATPEMMFAIAVIDTGYLASGICAVFDRGSRRLLANENPVLPSVCAQVDPRKARLIGPGIDALIERKEARILIKASWGHTDIDLALDASKSPPPMTAVAPVGPPGRFDLTQKTVLMPAEGEVRAGNIRFPVGGELAGLDYTHGYLARETSWRWAFANGRGIAFNFSDGFLEGEGENVVWLDGEPRPVGKVGFTFDGSTPMAQWRIHSDDGRVDLLFHPEGYRSQTIDLKLILSSYLQPFGVYSGTIHGVRIDDLAGVAEDHTARW
ncbi:MAG: DUF2804 domain-containing protein [Myxococcales bacterium]|nr:DUF2804 domain-containing protein [Myxococcales bacterium]